MVTFATSINELIDKVYFVTKLFGMAPYTKKIDKNNKRQYVVCRLGLQHVIINGGVLLFMWVAAIIRGLIDLGDHTPTFIDCVEGGMFIFMHAASTATMAFFVLKQNEFVICLDIINDIDYTMKKLNIPYSYRSYQLVYYLLLLIYPVYLFIIIAPIWKIISFINHDGFKYGAQSLIFQGISFIPTFAIRHTPLYYYCGFLTVAYQRLLSLNTYMLRQEVLNSTNYNFNNRLLSIIENTHSQIFQLARNTSAAFSVAMFFNLTITFLEFVSFFIIFSYSKNMETFQEILGFILFFTGAFISLVCCERLRSEEERMKRILCELTLPYFNIELAVKRKTIYLQMLHEKVELNASGFYAMDMQVLTSHVGTISTLLMFFLKLREDLVDTRAGTA